MDGVIALLVWVVGVVLVGGLAAYLDARIKGQKWSDDLADVVFDLRRGQ